MSSVVIDVDGDGDADLLHSFVVTDAVIWYENDGSQSFTTHVVTNQADNVLDARAIDVDGDADIDFLYPSPESE